MLNQKISKAVARELAIGFHSAVSRYIEQNKDAYLRYLANTGQTDHTIERMRKAPNYDNDAR